MGINKSRMVTGGLIGAAAMAVFYVLAWVTGITELRYIMMLGLWVTHETDFATWLVGLGIHLLTGIAFAVVYAVIFEWMRKATWWNGMIIGFVHTFFSGFVMWVLPLVHGGLPEHPEYILPGYMLINYGLHTSVGYILQHMLFGAIVGLIYTPATHRKMVPHRVPAPIH